MRRIVTGRQSRLLALVTVAALGSLPIVGAVGLGASACADAASPTLAPGLTDLRATLGDAMGSPAECALVDADGTIVQVTTTGLAVRRPDGLSVFASGDQHWALTDQGLQSWTGNWHDGLYPHVKLPPDQDQQDETTQTPPASVEAVTLVRVRQDVSNTVVVEDPLGSMYTVQTASGCPDVIGALGDHVFVRSAGSQSDLILLEQHETCAVAEMHATEGD